MDLYVFYVFVVFNVFNGFLYGLDFLIRIWTVFFSRQSICPLTAVTYNISDVSSPLSVPRSHPGYAALKLGALDLGPERKQDSINVTILSCAFPAIMCETVHVESKSKTTSFSLS